MFEGSITWSVSRRLNRYLSVQERLLNRPIMPLSRQPSSSAVSCSPRASVNPSSYVAIDTLLKTLKTCSRRMQTAFSTFHDELQILERLYYKGKNQHRSALFWKRAAEIKRYGERLDGMGLPDVLALLRCSFFGATTIQK